MDETKRDKIHLQNSNDPEILRKHIDTLNLLLQSKNAELTAKDESLKKIVTANQAIENEFRDFVDKIQQERAQQTHMLSAMKQQKGEIETKLDIFQHADHELRSELESYKEQLSDIKNHKDMTNDRYQSLVQRYQKILYLLYVEHNKNLVNQAFQSQANTLRDLIGQLNLQLREKIQKEQQSTERSKVLESKLNMYANAIGSKQQEIDQLKQQMVDQNIQFSNQISKHKEKENDIKKLNSQLKERNKLIQQIQQSLNDSYKKNEEIKEQMTSQINQLKVELKKSQIQSSKSVHQYYDDVNTNLPPNSSRNTPPLKSLNEHQQQGKKQAQDEELKNKEIERQLANVKNMTIDDIVNQAMNLAEDQSVSFVSDPEENNEVKNSQPIVVYNQQGQKDLEQLENIVKKNEISAIVVQKYLQENSILNTEQLNMRNQDDLLKQIQLMEQLIKFKDMQVETLKTSLRQKEHELEEWIYKAHQFQGKISKLEYLEQENSAVKQQIDLLTMIKQERRRQDQIISSNEKNIKKINQLQ